MYDPKTGKNIGSGWHKAKLPPRPLHSPTTTSSPTLKSKTSAQVCQELRQEDQVRQESPRLLKNRYVTSQCAACGQRIDLGALIYWDPTSHLVIHQNCETRTEKAVPTPYTMEKPFGRDAQHRLQDTQRKMLERFTHG